MAHLIEEKRAEFTVYKPTALDINSNHYRAVDLSKEKFFVNDDFHGSRFLTFRPRRATYGSIFQEFLPNELLSKIWDNNDWSYDSGKRHVFGGKFELAKIKKFLAIKIRIQGEQNVPTRNKLNPHALDISLQKSARDLEELCPAASTAPGRNILRLLESRFLIDHSYVNQVSLKFQSIVDEIGEYVAGDEKVDRFAGNSGHLRFVPNKPAKIGLWHYELTGLINNDTPYLLDTFTAAPYTQVGQSEFMGNIASHWCDVIARMNVHFAYKKTALCFDSYYMDSNTRTVLLNRNIPYSGSVQAGRFTSLLNKLQHLVVKPGDFACLYNEHTNEIFTHCYDRNQRLGRRSVLSNVLRHQQGVRHPTGSIPAYTAHGVMFSGCDKFNRELCDKMWPHKRGGYSTLGDRGKEDDFIFTCTLLNTWFATETINGNLDNKGNFLQFCNNLSQEIFSSV